MDWPHRGEELPQPTQPKPLWASEAFVLVKTTVFALSVHWTSEYTRICQCSKTGETEANPLEAPGEVATLDMASNSIWSFSPVHVLLVQQEDIVQTAFFILRGSQECKTCWVISTL